MNHPNRPQRDFLRIRTALGDELHDLIKDMAFRANDSETAERCYNRIENFLNTKALDHPDILLEPSINKCSHIIDVLHLPFIDKIKCNPDLRIAKSQAVFQLLTDFCKEEAARNEQREPSEQNALTWEAYARVMTSLTNDKFSPLSDSVAIGSADLVDSVFNEITDLRRRKLISDQTYADQFLIETQAGYSLLLSATASANTTVYNKIATELLVLHKQGIIDDKTYAEQFIKPDKKNVTPLLRAIKSGNTSIYRLLASKIARLHKDQKIDDETYLKQFTHPWFAGLTPLHEAAFTGNKDTFSAFSDDLMDALVATSESKLAANAKFKKELLRTSHDNFNVFHCATWVNEEKGSPNPFLVDAVITLFFDNFGPEEARKQIHNLYRQETRTELYETPYHEKQPVWLKRILSLSNNDPIKPSISMNH